MALQASRRGSSPLRSTKLKLLLMKKAVNAILLKVRNRTEATGYIIVSSWISTLINGPCSVMVARHTCTVTEGFKSHMCPLFLVMGLFFVFSILFIIKM